MDDADDDELGGDTNDDADDGLEDADGASDGIDDVVEQLQQALEAEDASDKDFHVRQALQLLEVDDGF